MKKAWILVILIVVLGGVGAALVGVKVLKGKTETAKVRFGEVELASVTSTVSAPGRIQPATQVNLSAQVPGRIVELAVKEGDSVEKDQFLLRLDDARYRSAVDQTEASLRSAKANRRLAQARLDKAEKDVTRLQGLRENDLASEDALERALTDHRVAQAEVEARAEDVHRTEAALAVSRDDLGKTVYRAPLAGTVSLLNVEEGENVVVGTMNNAGTVILVIADLAIMEVEAEVSETDVVSVGVGQAVEISVDAIPGETFEGEVVSVGNSGRTRGRGTVNEAINFEVRVRFGQIDDRLRPGMTADVDVRTETREGVLTVPIQSLVARSRSILARDHEAVADTTGPWADPDSLEGDALERWRKELVEGIYRDVDGTAEFVELEAGIADASRIEVTAVIEAGDRIVVGPYRVLRDLKEGTRLKEAKRDGGGK